MRYIKFILFIVLLLVLAFVVNKYYLTYDSTIKIRTDNTKDFSRGRLLKTMVVLADSHVDYERLNKALIKAKDYKPSVIIHLGDLSDFGGFGELSKSKQILQSSNFSFYVLPGDRDVVEEGKNFKQLFEDDVCTTQMLEDYKILCLSNPYNYTLLDTKYLEDFYSNLPKAKILITSQPIYNPTSNVYMGFFDENVKKQAENIYEQVSVSKVTTVFSGDAHFFSKYKDKTISFYNIGAVSNKRNLQFPNFSVVYIYENSVDVKQVTID